MIDITASQITNYIILKSDSQGHASDLSLVKDAWL